MPGPAREQPLEMVLAQAHVGGHLGQIRLAAGIVFQEADGLFDAPVVCGELGEVGHGLIVPISDQAAT